MRIAVVNWTRRMAGGAEATLAAPLPDFAAAGHELALWHEVDAPAERGAVPLPAGTVTWSAAALGAGGAVQALRAWRPDVLLAHGMLDPALERRVAELGPGVFFPHNYYGTCISGSKMLSAMLPAAMPMITIISGPSSESKEAEFIATALDLGLARAEALIHALRARASSGWG